MGVGGVFRVDFQVWVDFLYVRIPMVHADENLQKVNKKALREAVHSRKGCVISSASQVGITQPYTRLSIY